MLARVNLYEQAEAISLRGPHDSLLPALNEHEHFTLEEGAFFGNLFTDDTVIDCKNFEQVFRSQGYYDDCHATSASGIRE